MKTCCKIIKHTYIVSPFQRPGRPKDVTDSMARKGREGIRTMIDTNTENMSTKFMYEINE
jgi:hypothetical protein